MTGKPVVHFFDTPLFYTVELAPSYQNIYGQYADVEGYVKHARVYGLDHPVLGTDVIRTSIIVKNNDDGSFETLNTLYVPTTKEKHESK